MNIDLQKLRDSFQRSMTEASKIIIGQQELLQLLFSAILANGHILITGAPGLAKTLTIKTVARILGLSYSRIQFTPDLLPSDIIGVEVLDIDPSSGQKSFRYIQGPIFQNLVLADEINRSSPRTQSALLEAMQEKQVTIAGKPYPLPDPFIVFATRNPIDSEGVYPLPEAQLDRFLMEIVVPYPNLQEEIQIASSPMRTNLETLQEQMSGQECIAYQNMVNNVPVPNNVLETTVGWVRKTRPENQGVFQWGAGPRAAHHLIHAARAYALLYGEGVVTLEIIKKVFIPVLRHRVIPTFEHTRENISVDSILHEITAS